jgi:putative spermidine/putrescine transport system substrate-binding protein
MRRTALAGAVLLALAAGCRASTPEAPDRAEVDVDVVSEVGPGEGELNLLTFAGYAEDGTSDAEYDWVHPFERETGCTVHVRYVDSGSEILRQLTREGDQVYDGAVVSGDVSRLLIEGGIVAPVEPSLFGQLDQVLGPLRPGGDHARQYMVGGLAYGTPALYGANLLLYDAGRLDRAPTSWDVVFEPDATTAGAIAMLDSPMVLADAASYLATHEPDLGITDPYALTPAQLDASAELLEAQAPDVALWWTQFTDLVDAFRDGDVVVGQGSPIALSLLGLGGDRFRAAEPSEGMTGWADTWMLTADAPHPNCMLRWMRWTLTAPVQAELSLWYGAAPSNAKACTLVRERLGDFGDLADSARFGRCGDVHFLSSLALWRVPSVTCGDGRGRSCTDSEAWAQRWETIRGR